MSGRLIEVNIIEPLKKKMAFPRDVKGRKVYVLISIHI